MYKTQFIRFLRPVIPGLDIATSAAINIGLYLKEFNPNTSGKSLKLYKEARGNFLNRRENFLNNLKKLKNHLNKYLYYEEVLPRRPVTASSIKSKQSYNVQPASYQYQSSSHRGRLFPLTSRNAHIVEIFDPEKKKI